MPVTGGRNPRVAVAQEPAARAVVKRIEELVCDNMRHLPPITS